MHKDRLLTLAKFLRSVPEDKFDMSVWSADPAPPTIGCGYAGCAMGYACGMPEFQQLGLECTPTGTPRFGVAHAYSAAADFFGITYMDATQLFNPNDYLCASARITPAMVADRIEKLVAES